MSGALTTVWTFQSATIQSADHGNVLNDDIFPTSCWLDADNSPLPDPRCPVNYLELPNQPKPSPGGARPIPNLSQHEKIAVLNGLVGGIWPIVPIAIQQQISFNVLGPAIKNEATRELLTLKEAGGPVGDFVGRHVLDQDASLATFVAQAGPGVIVVAGLTLVSSLTTAGLRSFNPNLSIPLLLTPEEKQNPLTVLRQFGKATLRGASVGFGMLAVNSYATPIPYLKEFKDESVAFSVWMDEMTAREDKGFLTLEQRLVFRAAAETAYFFGSLVPETPGKILAWMAESANLLSFTWLYGLAIGKREWHEFIPLTIVGAVLSIMGGKNASLINRSFAGSLGIAMIVRQLVNLIINPAMAVVGSHAIQPLVTITVDMLIQVGVWIMLQNKLPKPADETRKT